MEKSLPAGTIRGYLCPHKRAAGEREGEERERDRDFPSCQVET